MSVYVDDMRARFGRMCMCHMIADSTAELVAAAAHCGVQAKWIQDAGTNREHFDICLSARRKAVIQGAVQITQRELAMKIHERRMSSPGTKETP